MNGEETVSQEAESREVAAPEVGARIGKAIFDGLSSFALTIILLLFLLALTFKGTLDQQHMSLYEVQSLYFNSLFFKATMFGVLPVYLPGVNLLLTILAVNLICGGLIRIRKKRATSGIIIVHLGILWMLSAGLVEFHFAQRGHLTLNEHQEGDDFVSYFEWEIVVGELLDGDRVREHLIPGEQFIDLPPDQKATFRSKGLPFHLVVRRFHPNSVPEQVPGGNGGVDGFFLRPMGSFLEAENNRAGAYLDVVDNKTNRRQLAILWGGSPESLPMTFRADGKDWTLCLRHTSHPMPFRIRLNKFTKLDHPGTRTPSVFSSQVTKFEDGAERDITISMNEPLRRKGFTLFQTNWGPQDVPNPRQLYSVFEVVRNPADQWPLWSCLVIALGLVWHFGGKLRRYILAQGRTA
ncbi:MAG: cytochrome c biogenesis protein ResB [Planctomycetota bacterium]